MVRGDRHPRGGTARPRSRLGGPHRLPGGRRTVRHDAFAVDAVRAHDARSSRGRALGARPSVNPEAPNEVDVSRPSDALEARAATDKALRNLLLGLGSVALVVGGVGIANVMVISVLERRGEIGVRRAMGAKRSHIAGQFLAEAASWRRSAASAASPSAPR